MIKGEATISEKGFFFNNSMSTDEPILDKALHMRGVLHVERNGNMEFENSQRTVMPPVIKSIADGHGYRVKRTSRNYLIQMKVPIIEAREVSERKIHNMLPVVMGEITLDRKEISMMLNNRKENGNV